MKQVLAFLTSDDFEDFTSQLIGLEIPGFVAVEGAGGDGGLDGLEGTTAYQMYFPEAKHRDSAHYIKKIDNTLEKLNKTITEEGLDVDRWILVVPDDLQYKVVIHLQKKSKETNIECLCWGATQLTALLAKHPQIRDNFPEVFFTDVCCSNSINTPRTEHNVEIITDKEYVQEKEIIREDIRSLARSDPEANYGFRKDVAKRLDELNSKKALSDRAYEIDLAEINEQFDEEVSAKQSDHARRGIVHSGIALQNIEKINVRRGREIERLKMKYGKNNIVVVQSGYLYSSK